MNLEELKKIRQQNFLAHKKKKRAYYLKKKQEKETKKVIYDYAKDLSDDNFALKIKEIAKLQKGHLDDRKEIIIEKLNEYKKRKQEYYLENKEKRLEYDKKYREEKKEELKRYRKEYYQKNKEKILQKQKEKRAKTQDKE